jgi:hypothetical protein
VSVDDRRARFRTLQEGLRDMWPALTPRSVGDVERTVVVVYSMTVPLPPELFAVVQAFEERFLCVVLTLLRAPRSHVVYVTSQPVLPRLVDYWFSLVPDLDTPQARERLHLVSVVDGRPLPLTEKVLAHPRLVERIRLCVADPRLAFIVPFISAEPERELALQLGIPLYGPDPDLAHWGTKSGSRRAFREAGVPHPVGVEDVASREDVTRAVESVCRRRPEVRELLVKVNEGVSGYGIGLVRLEGRSAKEAVRDVELAGQELTPEGFFGAIEQQGGIVEERVSGAETRSPSVQMRVSPDGRVGVLATHDQILGGPQGRTYLGCRFPASPEYALDITAHACRVGELLAREGVIGRFAIDFLATRDAGAPWRVHALEINLRNGGTTHPLTTLQALTEGVYEPDTGIFRTPEGAPRHYFATDHLERPGYVRLTPDDFLDYLEPHALGWSSERQTGVVFHMVSAIGVAGQVGVTAIGESPEQARWLYLGARHALDEEAARLGGLRRRRQARR